MFELCVSVGAVMLLVLDKVLAFLVLRKFLRTLVVGFQLVFMLANITK